MNMIGQYGFDKTLVRDLVQLRNSKFTFLNAQGTKLGIGIILFAIISIWFFLSGEVIKGGYATVVCFLVFGMSQSLTFQAWYDISGQINAHALIVLTEKFIFFSSVVFIVAIDGERSFEFIISSLLITRLTFLLIEFRLSKIKNNLIDNFSIRKIVQLASFNFLICLSSAGNILMTSINQIILLNKTSAKLLANYGLAFQFSMIIRLLQLQIVRLSAPKIAQVTKPSISNRMKLKAFIRLVTLSFSLTLIIIIPFYLLSPIIIPVFNSQYLDSIPILNILFIWNLIFSIGLISSQFVIGLKHEQFYFFTTIFSGGSSILFSLYFVPIYQGVGAAISLLLAHSLSICLQTAFVIIKLRR